MAEEYVKTDTGNYVRLGAYRSVHAVQSGSDWHLWMDTNDGAASVSLFGTYTSESEAQEVARRLTNGVDVSSLA